VQCFHGASLKGFYVIVHDESERPCLL
jgi:hypothetical protein